MEKIKICLISCVSQKTNYPTKCKDLYISPLFKKTWNYVRDIEKPQGVYILSALHGLIRYDQVIEPYDKTLLDMSKEEALEWAEKVKKQINETFVKDGKTLKDFEFVVFAGSKYYENLKEFFETESTFTLPLGSLPIGKRLGALTQVLKTGKKLEIV